MNTIATAWMLGCVCGFFMGVTMGVTVASPSRDRDPGWRRSFNHENTNRPSGPPPLILNEGRTIRSNGVNAPTTPKPDIIPKPQFPSPRIIRDDFLP